MSADFPSALTLPISRRARQLAEQFASEQPSVAKAQQIHQNTLAVWVVHEYLQLMGIRTDLAAGDSWNPVLRWATNVADLQVKGLGRIECRPMAPGALTCAVPPEVWCDRIGYMAVAINPTFESATLVGFLPAVSCAQVSVTALQPPDHLLDRLYDLQVQPHGATQPQTYLSQWVTGIFDQGWQSVEALLDTLNLPTACPVRSVALASPQTSRRHVPAGLRRAKLITLRSVLGQCPLILVLYIEATTSRMRLTVQVYPGADQFTLPPEVQLQVIDELDVPFLQARSQQADSYLQLQFWGNLGESLAITLTWGGTAVVEHFVI